MHRKATLIVLFLFSVLLTQSAFAQTASSDIDQLKAQIELLKQQQAASQQMIEKLENKIEAMQKPQSVPANEVLPADQAQMDTVSTGTNPKAEYTGMFNPYASLRNIVSVSDSTAVVQDNASRVGINLNTFGAIKVFGTAEWGVNLVRSQTTLNPGASTASGFGVLTQDTQPVFATRLGFLGIDLGKFGRLSFGKQNSTHYDITQYTTDRFNVFGGTATTTYVAGTDGGQSGTGRADQTILYNIKFAKIFEFGA
jgi:hypothetical protein